MKFGMGDRIKLTVEALLGCNPAISDEESRGTVRGSDLDPIDGERLLIEFDNGELIWIDEAGRFELMNHCDRTLVRE